MMLRVKSLTRDVVKELDFLFHPDSIAIVGASNNPKKFGYMFMSALIEMGFEGRIYPVNPHEEKILDFKAYPRVREIPETVDLALLVVPPQAVLEVVRDCADKGVKGIIIFTAGFGERGGEGKKLEQEIVRIARMGGTRIIGPNCQGIYCPSSKLTFFPGMPKEFGSVGFISHSGSLAVYLTNIAHSRGIHFSKVISCGNECDLNAVDFLEYLGRDPDTKVIITYLEGVKDGRRFLTLAREISKNKPIIIWKGGTTEAGSKAAASHTGALAGSTHIWRAVFKQTGIIWVRSIEEALDCLLALVHMPSLPEGRRVAVVSGMGGPSVVAVDACVDMGLEPAEFSEETQRRLREVVPTVGTNVRNPVDLSIAALFTPDVYARTIEIASEDADIIMILFVPVREIVHKILEGGKAVNKPLVGVCLRLSKLPPEEYRALLRGGIPLYPCVRRAARVIAKLVEYKEFLDKHMHS